MMKVMVYILTLRSSEDTVSFNISSSMLAVDYHLHKAIRRKDISRLRR